jgi:hypothetical protein
MESPGIFPISTKLGFVLITKRAVTEGFQREKAKDMGSLTSQALIVREENYFAEFVEMSHWFKLLN